ncbi:MAG: hypothetical protein O2816_06160 [Planctomycetota bacterium]|nr:hypothetical protein [Planctomycetota bacterium]
MDDEVERAIGLIDGMDHPEWILRTKVQPIWDWVGELALSVINVLPNDYRPTLRQWGGRGISIQQLLKQEGIDLHAYMRFIGEGDPDAK